ncbi:hypothetical protein [Arthrobacter sp. 18067]|uniref:hypothetical protein n=1 Tax=Arthrobacter sp. 18067 TaxID=2681413 RepID=UPI001358A526|nr:hypothetical protein [Arthrobacter sp. 18067]
MKPNEVRKFGGTIKLSDEQYFEDMGWRDPRYLRMGKVTKTPATPEAWEQYRAAVAGLAALEAYDGTRWDYGSGAPDIPEPEPTSTIEYLETVDEWLDRCRAMAHEDAASRKTSRRLDPKP